MGFKNKKKHAQDNIEEKQDDKIENKLSDTDEKASKDKKRKNKKAEADEVKSDDKVGDKADDKTGEKAGDKSDEKSDDKAGEKTDEKVGEKSDEKSDDKANDKTDDKADEKADDKAGDKANRDKADKKKSEEKEADIEETSEKKKKKRRKKKKKTGKPEDVNIVRELLSLIVYIGIVVLLCFLIINFVGCRSRVDGESMMPTLSNKDNLWVDKLSYTFGDPKRFDVIIFNYNEDTTYVKRIIGLPGETVRIDQEGKIYINEQLLVENYGKEKIGANNLGRASQPVLLGEDEYFVLGDNRNNSSDSRWADVGNVNREDIVGKVVLRIYPFKDFGFVK